MMLNPLNFLQRWHVIQYDLIPELKEEVGLPDTEIREAHSYFGMGQN